MAYMTADYERWQQLDFVVGIRIELSNNHTLNGKTFRDICDELSAPLGSTNTEGKGCYPKDFKFSGWHPLCRCHVITILKTDEEIAEDTRRILAGEPLDGRSVNRVDDVPQEFTDWVEANRERMAAAKSLPYFIKDNKDVVDGILNPKQKVLTTLEKAKLRHDARTPEQIEAIKNRWAERQHKHEIIKKTANNVLKVASDYGEVDFSKLQQFISAGNLTAMAKLDSWSSLTLEQQAKKLKFEAIDYLAGNMRGVQKKYHTWEVSQAAYIKALQETSEKWMLNLIKQGDIYDASTASDLYAEAVLAISNKKYGKQQSVLSVAREKKAAQNLKKYLKEMPINPHYIWGGDIGGKYNSMLNKRKSLAAELKGVTADDLTLVTRFSSGMTFYNAYNLRKTSAYWKKVWTDKMSNLSLAEIADCERIIEEYTLALDGIINKMKRYEGIVYRGVWGEGAGELLSQFHAAWRSKSKIWVNKAATSSSTDIKVSYYSFDNKGDNDLIMIIKNKSGSYIRPISEYDYEKEVLLMKDVKYKVAKKPYILNGKWFVELEEI